MREESWDEIRGTAGALNADAFSVTCPQYNKLSVHVTGTFTGVITLQGSNDGTNFQTVSLKDVSSLGGSDVTTISGSGATNIVFTGPICLKYIRARMTSYTSGTAIINAVFQYI